jgi:hypothetical protein
MATIKVMVATTNVMTITATPNGDEDGDRNERH